MANNTKQVQINVINNSSILKEQLTTIIRRFKHQCQFIIRLLNDTDKSYNEINEKRILTSGMLKKQKKFF